MAWKILVIAACYGLITWPVGWVVGRITRSWQREIAADARGLKRGGLWIGCLERILVLTFLMLADFQAIGFLVTAKSILRFGTISKASRGSSFWESKVSEYIIIGTLLSFVLCLPFGAVVRWAWMSMGL